MEYKEYGSKNNDIIILLHGGGLSWWNYIDEISLLENEFHIVIPILDGHSGSDTNFTSIESNALEIINFIKLSCFLFMEYYFEAFTISINSFSASTASARPREFFITKPSKDFNAFSLPPK